MSEAQAWLQAFMYRSWWATDCADVAYDEGRESEGIRLQLLSYSYSVVSGEGFSLLSSGGFA